MKQKKYFVHPTADVSKDAIIGKNVKIWHQAQVREEAVIGDNCIIGKGVYIDKGVKIGKNVKIQNYASIYYQAVIEDGVFIGPYVCLTNDRYPKAVGKDGKLLEEGEWKVGKIHVKKGASLGAGVIVLPDVTIGEESLLGAGSVVTGDVAGKSVVAGVPAKEIKKR